jgi:hypothetical protein
MELCTDLVLHASPTPEQACRYPRWWPWRLLEVTGRPVIEDDEKAGFRQLRVLREVPVERSFGPNGSAVLAIVRQAESMTPEQGQRLAVALNSYPARYAARAAAWNAAQYATARYAAWDAARDAAARGPARHAAWDVRDNSLAALAAVVADLVGQHGLTQDHIDTLMAPWHAVFGKENA